MTDDTRAFLAALSALRGGGPGAIYVPAGRYVITQQLRIAARSRIVLRGARTSQTVLLFPRSLTDALGASTGAAA